MNILIANVGSTSFKFQLFDGISLEEKARGRLERIGSQTAPVQFHTAGGTEIERQTALPDFGAAIHYSIDLLSDPEIGVIRSLDEIAAVGFKPVHAREMVGCRLFTDDILAAMEEAVPLAPAHNPPYIAAVRQYQALFPNLPLYGLFEPTFHQTIPDYAAVYGVPFEWIDTFGLKRYGFHGASHRYISERTPAVLNRPADSLKIVSCHLGGSSSVCAIDGGRSVDTSMGLTPQSGLMQSTRSGDLDPFAVLDMMDRKQMTTDDMRSILCRDSGLQGLSGVAGGDMRDIMAARDQGDARAALTVDAFVHEVKKYIGAYAAAMNGLDAVVFTGGIGERSAEIRARICEGLTFLGVRLDRESNRGEAAEMIISEDEAKVAAVVIAANEEYIIVREVVNTMREEKNITL